MKIALINEYSQSGKNDIIFDVLKSVAEPLGHTVFNYGMYSYDGATSLCYVNVGLLSAVLLNSGAVDFVVSGCGTGEGVTIACNSFPGVQCGLVADSIDAHLFLQINNGNAVSIPYSERCGMEFELKLTKLFEELFKEHPGMGYPDNNSKAEQEAKTLMDKVKKVTHHDMMYILDNLDKEIVVKSLSTEKFSEYFYKNCTDDNILCKVKSILND